MSNCQKLPQVIELRAKGLTPKAIARALSMRPAEVAPLIRAAAMQQEPAGPPTLVGCWISDGWSSGLTWDGHPEWVGDRHDPNEPPGLVTVLAARKRRQGSVSVAGFLVDPGCLGVKNALGPRTMTEVELFAFVQSYFRAHEGYQAVPIELAQELVLGAVDYASTLGFAPHVDFEPCRHLLGDWHGPSCIRFGHRGKPFFMAGPDDDAIEIMRILERPLPVNGAETDIPRLPDCD